MKVENLDINLLCHYGDILAIPFFFILDIFYTYIFFKQQDKKLA